MRNEDALYLRKSRADVELEKEGELETLAKHKKILLELANKQNLNVVKIYEEVVSGESVQARPEMQKLLKDIYMKKYRSVIVMEVERLARGATKDQGEVAEAFKFSNTKIVTPAKTYDPNNEFDEEYFEFGLFMSRREYKTIQRRLHTGKMQSVKDGNYMGSLPPYGYDIWNRGKHDRTLKRNEQSKYIPIIFEWFVNDRLNAGEISRRLTAMGVPTRTGKPEWHRATIKDILKNHLYIGKVRWFRRKVTKDFDGELMKKVKHRNTHDEYLIADGKHEPLISEELFNKAQTLFTGIVPTNTAKLVNPFAGILKCSKCGKLMSYHSYKHKKGNVRPRIIHVESELCKVKSCFFDDVMSAVIEALNSHISDFTLTLNNSNKNEEKRKYEQLQALMREDLKKLEIKKDKLFDNFEDGIYTKAEFLERKKINTAKIEKLKQELANLTPPNIDDIEFKIVKFSEVVKSLKDESISVVIKNNLLKDIIKSIEYTNNNTIELDIHLNS